MYYVVKEIGDQMTDWREFVEGRAYSGLPRPYYGGVECP